MFEDFGWLAPFQSSNEPDMKPVSSMSSVERGSISEVTEQRRLLERILLQRVITNSTRLVVSQVRTNRARVYRNI